MPKTKQEEEKKKKTKAKKSVTKKTSPKAISKKSATKKNVVTTGAQAITIDVIADNEDVLFQEPVVEKVNGSENRDSLDVQKKFFSELVAEMKDKKENHDLPLKSDIDFTDSKSKNVPRKSLRLYRRMALQSVVLTFFLLLVVGYFLVPSLKIVIRPNFEVVADSLSFRVSTDDTKVDSIIASSSRNLKGTLTIIPISADKIYEAKGEEVLGEEVVGEVTLHNEYNRDQPLVVNTRLLSEDNKLFRLTESVNIPANSTIKASVYADQPSQDMAIGSSRFSIPGLWLGLQDRIYATSESNFEYRHQVKSYVKQSDLDQAMIDIKNVLIEKSEQNIKSLESSGEQIAYLLDNNSIEIELGAKLGEEVSSFSVSAKNNLIVASFSKEQAESLVKAKLSFLLPDDKRLSDFETSSIVYRLEAFNEEENSASVSAAFKANMSLKADANIIDRKQLVGLNQEQIAEYLKSFTEIDSYRLEFFPKFIKSAPILPDRIKVEVME